MSYVKQWDALKQDYDKQNKVVAKQISALKKEIKAEKKEKSEDFEEYIKVLEDEIQELSAMSRKKTGVTPMLRLYDSLLPKAEKMMNKKIPPWEKKKWKPVVKEFEAARAAQKKAITNVQKHYMSLAKETDLYASRASKYATRAPALKSLKRQMTANSLAARSLTSGLDGILSEMSLRMNRIRLYLGRFLTEL